MDGLMIINRIMMINKEELDYDNLMKILFLTSYKKYSSSMYGW